MRGLWLCVLLWLAPALALAGEPPDIHIGSAKPPLDSRYSYIEVHHVGTQDRPPPTLWIGTPNDAPSRPANLDARADGITIPTPVYAGFIEPVSVTSVQYRQILAISEALSCRSFNTHDWSALTVSIFKAGRRQLTCFISGNTSRDYVAHLIRITGARPAHRGRGLPWLVDFLASHKDVTPNIDSVQRDNRWLRLHHDADGALPYPEIWLGTDALTPYPAQGSGVTRLILNDRQYQFMEDIRYMSLICRADKYETSTSDVLSADAEGKPHDCLYHGPATCYYLHTLYSLSTPSEPIKGMDSVYRMAERTGCNPETWPESAPD
jgi:hypothetical protein